MPDYSEHQKKIIKRYYDNRDQVDEQRLGELVADLYLSSGKKQARLWESAQDIMLRMKIPASRIEHIMKSANPALLAEVVQELQAGILKVDKK